MDKTMVSDSQQEILDLQQQAVWSALKAKDAEAWGRILADEFVYRSPGEADENKTDFIRRISSFPATVVSITSDDLRADVYSEAAIVTGVQCAVVRLSSGFQIEDFTMLNNVFVKRDDQWQMVLAHAMNLPA